MWPRSVCLASVVWATIVMATPVMLGAKVDAPINLRALVSGSTVSFSWDAVSGATGYRIEAGTRPGTSDVATVLLPPTTSYAASDVPSGVYFVRLIAIGTQLGGSSNEVTITIGSATLPGSCSTPPDPPSGLRATTNGGQVTLSWTPSAIGCPATSYVVRAGSSAGTVDLAQLRVSAPFLSVVAPDGVYFVSVVATNAFGASVPTGTLVLPVASPSLGGRVSFNTVTPAIVADEHGNAVILGEVVNRSLLPAVFIRVAAQVRGPQGQTLGTFTAFLRGETRRLAVTGVTDSSALAAGEIGCFNIQTTVPLSSVKNAQLQLAHDTFANNPPRNKVKVADVSRVSGADLSTLSVAFVNSGTEQTLFHTANVYLKRSDGRAVGCDFALSEPVLAPGQGTSLTLTTEGSSNASTVIPWMHWQEGGDPLGALAAQTFAHMRALVSAGQKRSAIAAWESLQEQRRAYVHRVGR